MTFKELLDVGQEEVWTKEDLKSLIDDLDDEDIDHLTEIVIDMIDFDNGEFDEDETNEKLSRQTLKKAKIKRKKAPYKKAQRMKQRCMKKHGDKVRKSQGMGNQYYCSTSGKLLKSENKSKRRKRAITKKRNKSKITS